MSSTDDDEASVVRFPQSRVRPPAEPGGFADLGISQLATQIGLTKRDAYGHWCSRCRGIWFGYLLEAECPVCHSRAG